MTIDNAKNSLLIPWSLVTAMMPSEVSSPQLLFDLDGRRPGVVDPRRVDCRAWWIRAGWTAARRGRRARRRPCLPSTPWLASRLHAAPCGGSSEWGGRSREMGKVRRGGEVREGRADSGGRRRREGRPRD